MVHNGHPAVTYADQLSQQLIAGIVLGLVYFDGLVHHLLGRHHVMHKRCGGTDYKTIAARVIEALLQGRHSAPFRLGVVLFEKYKVTSQEQMNMIVCCKNPQLPPQIIGFFFTGHQAQTFPRCNLYQLLQKISFAAAGKAA